MSHCDTFTAVGGDKEICQDYVQSYKDDTVIVTDGCGSARDTDIGSRLLNRYEGGAFECCQPPDLIACNLGLPTESLYCTLLKIQLEGTKIYFLRVGDGFFAYSDVTKTTIEQFIYTQNAPFYVGYQLYNEIEKFKQINQHLIKKVWTYDEKFQMLSKEFTIIKDPEQMLDEFTEYDATTWKFAAVASDGLDSFYPEGGLLLEEVVLPKFFNFKNLYGNFLKRRAKAALRELKADGYSNLDDISIGAIVL